MKKLALAITLALVAAIPAYASQSFAGQQAGAQMVASVATDADASNGTKDFLTALESRVGISHAEPVGGSANEQSGATHSASDSIALNGVSDGKSVGFAHTGNVSVLVGVSKSDVSVSGSQRTSSHGRVSPHAEGATMTRCVTQAGAGVKEEVCEYKTISMEEAENYFTAHATN